MNVAFIPVRGGSKSIPLKNIKEIAGKPLIYWVASAASKCNYIDKVYISTDSDEIKSVVENLQIEKTVVIGRSEDTATDTASTESALLEFANKYVFDNVFLIQATSPLLTSYDLERGYSLFNSPNTDSVLSVVRQKRFCWETKDDGYANPLNYDVFNRPRRQEYEGYLVENGAFYISSKANLLKTHNRISGKIRTYEMDESTYFEIDEPSDWIIIEELLRKRINNKKFNDTNLSNIKMFLTDCDGCLTDGGMYYSEKGDELKKFNTLDGMGFKLLREKGILTGIITGETRELNKRRAKKLGVDILVQGASNKYEIILELCEKYKVRLDQVVYIGDDINDLEVVEKVGFGCCVPNGDARVRAAAKYVTQAHGGQGAIREVADLIM
ncbi:acylneuraminate cytidylyltransferase [Butyrivibrio sp.]|uniref:acylneuraminate cytidylyltransferase n=1 Tax=Butyrivibrio sp. TaxID=28121 RepID=UPI0025BE7C91|nr:acylneuraminate cytidylyltransferase [Butyrivibrio sp.]MBQ9301567.1 acylneuraminate cytidylyltransferase [Butyrivibrio sp.]